jgi:Fe-Mn family superoxide dismutase
MDAAESKGFPILGFRCLGTCLLPTLPKQRPDYINNWWKVVNWKYVQERYESVI